MNPEDVTQLRKLIKTHKRRLYILQQQAAAMGGQCPPHIITEIEDIQERINTFDRHLNSQIISSYVEGKKITTQFGHELDNINEDILQGAGFIEKTEYRIFGIPILSISRVITTLMLLVALGGALFIIRLAVQINRGVNTTATTQIAIISTNTPTSVTPEPATIPAVSETTTQTRTPITQLPVDGPNTIRIALQSPQSGGGAAIGIGILRGAELSVSLQNRPLTDLGYKIGLAPFDDGNSIEAAKANAQAIVADPETLCVVSHYSSSVTLATQPIYAGARLVQISPSSTNPAVTDNTDTVWRLVGRDDIQGAVAAQYAREALKSQRSYVLNDGTIYGKSISNSFISYAQTNAMQIVGVNSYDDSQVDTDFKPFINDIQTLNPDLIYFAGSYSRAGVFFKQLREKGITAQFLGSDSLDTAELVSIAGPAVNGMHFTTVSVPIANYPQAQQFAKDYKNQYEEDATSFSAEAYDATTLCIQAIARAARSAGGKPTRSEVLNAMRSLRTFQGISGNYTFNNNGDPQSAQYFVIEVNSQNWSDNKVVDTIQARPPS